MQQIVNKLDKKLILNIIKEMLNCDFIQKQLNLDLMDVLKSFILRVNINANY